MRLRTRFILFAAFQALVSLVGVIIIITTLQSLSRNQEITSFKNSIFYRHKDALQRIYSAQSRLYQHQAGYTRNIDLLINEIMILNDLTEEIPSLYRARYNDSSCTSCHDDVDGTVENLESTIVDLAEKIKRYQEYISIILTSSDKNTRIVYHGAASAAGDSIMTTYRIINRSASLMIADLNRNNYRLIGRAKMTIEVSIAVMTFVSLFIVIYFLYVFSDLTTSLLEGTESISRNDFTQRLPMADKKDELGLLASRFNLMARHLEVRDREIHEKTGEVEKANFKLRDLNENLELRIKERTVELEQYVQKLQATAAALEDSKRKMESTNLELVRANQAKSNFLSIVSHELKTPLSVINGFLSLILDERYQNDPKNLVEAVQISKRRGEQLARMIDELIDLSRLDAQAMVLNKELLPLEPSFKDVVAQFTNDLGHKHLTLKINLPSDLAPVKCDHDKLRQVLTNLVSNAIKFSHEGGEIELGARDQGEEVIFSCSDGGIGLAAAELEKVFDKFYQVDSSATRRYGGAGLGLSIVKEIVHLHGGKIWVESESGKGCTFFFSLPRDGQAA